MKETYYEIEQLLNTKLIHQKPIAKLIHANEIIWWLSRIEKAQLQTYFDGFKSTSATLGINTEYELAIIRESGYVNLKELIKKYSDYLRQKHMLLSDDFNFNDIEIKPDGIKWKNVYANKIICCKGSYSNDNPYLPKDIFYLTKGDVLTTKIPELSAEYIINKNIFILPKGDEIFTIGSTYTHDDLSWDVNSESGQQLLQKAQLLINKPIQLLAHNVGIRPTVKDRRPILGEHPEHKNITFFNGLGTKGVMLAPYFAKEMVNFLEIENYALSDEININRFFA